MSKRKNLPAEPAQPNDESSSGRRVNRILAFRFQDEELRLAMEQWCVRDNRDSLNNGINTVLLKWLEERGFWPYNPANGPRLP